MKPCSLLTLNYHRFNDQCIGCLRMRSYALLVNLRMATRIFARLLCSNILLYLSINKLFTYQFTNKFILLDRWTIWIGHDFMLSCLLEQSIDLTEGGSIL